MFTNDYGATAKSDCDLQKTMYGISRIPINESLPFQNRYSYFRKEVKGTEQILQVINLNVLGVHLPSEDNSNVHTFSSTNT
jgi:hypothetical protein